MSREAVKQITSTNWRIHQRYTCSNRTQEIKKCVLSRRCRCRFFNWLYTANRVRGKKEEATDDAVDVSQWDCEWDCRWNGQTRSMCWKYTDWVRRGRWYCERRRKVGRRISGWPCDHRINSTRITQLTFEMGIDFSFYKARAGAPHSSGPEDQMDWNYSEVWPFSWDTSVQSIIKWVACYAIVNINENTRETHSWSNRRQ